MDLAAMASLVSSLRRSWLNRVQPEHQIALFGPCGVGKSVYLSVSICGSAEFSYGFELNLIGPDANRSHQILTDHYKLLCQSSWPPATVFDAPSIHDHTYRLNFQTRQWDRTWSQRLQVVDFGGELTQITPEADHAQLKSEVFQRYFASADAIMIFVRGDLGKPGTEHPWEYKLQIDQLLSFLEQRGRLDIPVALIISKWDICTDKIGLKASEKEIDESENFVRLNHPRMYRLLTDQCDCVEFFPVSSTGRLKGDKPTQPLQPFNVHAPWTWLVEQSDRRRGRRLETIGKRAGAGLASLAIACILAGGFWEVRSHCRSLDTAKAMMDEPFAGQPRREQIEQIEAILQVSQHRLKAWDPWLRETSRRHEEYLRQYHLDQKAAIQQLLSKADQLEFGRLVAHAALYQDYVDHEQTRDPDPHPGSADLDELARILNRMQFSESLAKPETAAQLSQECHQYARRFPDGPPPLKRALIDVGAWLKVHEELVRATEDLQHYPMIIQENYLEQGYQCFRALGVRIAREIGEAADSKSMDRRCQILTRFTEQIELPWSISVEQILDREFQRYDDLTYKTARQKSSRGTHVEDTVKPWQDYLDYRLADRSFLKHRTEAATQIDRLRYTDLLRKLKDAGDPASFQAARQSARRYREGGREIMAMTKFVQDWASWYDRLLAGINLEVGIRTLKVDRSSSLAPTFGSQGQVTVELKVNQSKQSSAKFKFFEDKTIRNAGRIGRFRVDLFPSSIELTLITSNYLSSSIKRDLGGGPSALSRLNDPITLDSDRVEVQLNCPGLQAPALPRYGTARP